MCHFCQMFICIFEMLQKCTVKLSHRGFLKHELCSGCSFLFLKARKANHLPCKHCEMEGVAFEEHAELVIFSSFLFLHTGWCLETCTQHTAPTKQWKPKMSKNTWVKTHHIRSFIYLCTAFAYVCGHFLFQSNINMSFSEVMWTAHYESARPFIPLLHPSFK